MNDSQKIQQLLDLAEITKLKAQYGDFVDQAVSHGVEHAKKVADLFAPEFELDLRETGMIDSVMTTHDDVVTFFGTSLYEAVGWNRHAIINPILDVRGDEASGQWLIHAYATLPDDPQASPAPITVYGRYFDEYVRTSDGWKFRTVRFVNDTRTGEKA